MLDSSDHYVPYDRLTQISEDSRVQDAFRIMSETQTGSLLVCAGEQPRWYVPGDWLKEVYDKLRLEPGLEAPAVPENLTLQTLLTEPLAGPPGQLVEVLQYIWKERETEPSQVLPISIADPVSINEEASSLQDRSDAVFLVLDDSRQPVGWFLNHEDVLQGLLTRPPVFVCTNGHENPDPDEGRCYYCPAPIRV